MFESQAPPEKRLGLLSQLDQQLNQKRQVKLKTCADVYNYWRLCKRLYKKAPKDGVEFQVEYIDTGLILSEEVRATAPIALALHGAPGSYHDFALLIQHLSQQNVRVIAPNFPEYTATVRTKVLFRHSADEKAAFLRDFLRAINVNKIDLLVSHSSAIFPTLLILLNANEKAIAKQRCDQQQQREQPNNTDHCQASDNKNGSKSTSRDINFDQAHDTQVDDNFIYVNVDEKVATACDDAKQELRHEIDTESAKARAEEGEKEKEKEKEENDVEEDDEVFVDARDKQTDDNNNLHDASKPSPPAEATDCQKRRKKLQRQENATTRKAERCKRRSQDVIVQFDQPIEIKAVALFNPAGHRLPKSMKPTWFKCGSVRIYQHKLGRSLFRKFGPPFLTLIGVPVRVDNMDNVMLSATVMRNSKCQRVVEQLEQLSRLKMPTLLVFSENDKLIEKEIFYEMTQFMRLEQKNFDIFNNDGDIELSQSSTEDWIRVMVFKAGGHYAYSNYAKTVNKAVSELLQKVVKKPLNDDELAPIASC